MDSSQGKNYDIHAKRLVFAMDTDGYDLLVDLSSEECQLMLRQFGEADHLGLTIQDLLDATRTPLWFDEVATGCTHVMAMNRTPSTNHGSFQQTVFNSLKNILSRNSGNEHVNSFVLALPHAH